VRRRLVADEGDHLLLAARRLARPQLVMAGELDGVEAREHLVRRRAHVDLLDVHGRQRRPLRLRALLLR
jgi:hypothetical protein